MTTDELTALKKTYTGQTVTIEALRPELTRWANLPGRVVTINCNGRALVQFEGADKGFYDIDPDYSDSPNRLPKKIHKAANMRTTESWPVAIAWHWHIAGAAT